MLALPPRAVDRPFGQIVVRLRRAGLAGRGGANNGVRGARPRPACAIAARGYAARPEERRPVPERVTPENPRIRDVVVYGTVAWDRPWLTEQNLAHALARRRRVVYVEPPLTPLTPFRYGVRRDTLRDARRLLPPSLRRDRGVDVLRLLGVPPLEHPRARRIGRPFVRRQVRRATERLELRDPVVVAARAIPDLVGAAGENGLVYLVKDLVTSGAGLLGRDAGSLAEEEQRMCELADVVCVTSRALQDTFARRGIETMLLPHGFHADLAPLYERAEPPPEYEGLGRPLLGYAGRIDERLDFDALVALADRFPAGTVVMIGPVSPRLPRPRLAELTGRSNVRFLGPRSRTELPAYLRHLDCTLMPYREDEWGRHGSPLKLWDALYAGPPVVGSGYVVLRDHPGVGYAAPPSRLPDVVAEAVDNDNDRERELRRAHAAANTWEQRVLDLERVLDDRLDRR